MKLGVKIYPNSEEHAYADYFGSGGSADFIEVMAILGADYSFMQKYNIPIVVHAQHSKFGTNIADSGKRAESLKALRFAQSLAGMFNSKIIITHIGYMEGEYSTETAIGVLKRIGDKRIVIENGLSAFDGNMETIKHVIKEAGCGFCIDVSHAMAYARHSGTDGMKQMGALFRLKPRIVHVCDGFTDSGKDLHMNLGEGDFPLAEIKKMIPRTALVTLETPVDIEAQKKNILFFRRL